ANETSPSAVYAAAQRYVAAGLSLIPIAADGSKSPDWRRLPMALDEREKRWKPSWKIYQVRPPNETELHKWRDVESGFGIAAVGGVVSGGKPGCGLEIIDFDTAELAAP